MKEIPLTRGFVALVDDKNFDRLKDQTWFAITKKTGLTYAARTDYLGRVEGRSKCKRRYMHHEIIAKPERGHVDHRDGNGCNNQEGNLFPASFSQNQANRKRVNKNNSSGFKGVTFNRQRGKWVAQIMIDRKNFFLGYFAAAELAAEAYDRAALKAWGDFSSLNLV